MVGNSLIQEVNGLLEVVVEGDFHIEVGVQAEVEGEGADNALEETVDGADSEIGIMGENVFQQCFRAVAYRLAVES